MGYPHYWSRQRKFTRTERALTLHFTHHPGDLIIRVALENQPAHDVIIAPPGATDRELFALVRDYTKAVTKDEARALKLTERVGSPTP